MEIFLYVCLAFLVLVLLVLGLYLTISSILYHRILTRYGKSLKNARKANLKTESDEEIFKSYKILTLSSDDGLNLKGFYKNQQSNKLIILVHGYGQSHFNMSKYITIFEKKNFDILAIDMRCHGESEGKNITLGEKESQDLLGWIEKMLSINPQYKIGLFGIGMGATSVCMLLREKLCKNVILAIENSGYDNADKLLKYKFSHNKVFGKLLYKMFCNYTKKSCELDLKKIDVIPSVKSSKIPILIFHSKKDEIVPVEMASCIASQLPIYKKDVVILEEGNHYEVFDLNRATYEKTLNDFLGKYNF